MVEKKVPEYDHVLVIGNGFDLDLGLKTSYTDFIASKFFLDLVSTENETARYLQKKHNLQNWVDIEGELAVLSSHTDTLLAGTEIFRAEYKAIRNALVDYIAEVESAELKAECTARGVLSSLINSGGSVVIVSFNYTFTPDRLLSAPAVVPAETAIYRVHGQASYEYSDLDRGRIVFGVQDSANINSDHSFLLKSASPVMFDQWKVGELMAKAKQSVTVFGHSLGETDHSQFLPFFDNEKVEGIKIRVNYHSVDSHDELMNQIHVLTNRKLHDFKIKHDFQMVGPEYESL